LGRLAGRAPATERCPTGAISLRDDAGLREVRVDLGLCTFCGECAARDRAALVRRARYTLNADGTHQELIESTEAMGSRVREVIHRTFGRSLATRQVDAGSCNGCELEIVALRKTYAVTPYPKVVVAVGGVRD
jgi:ferredoxin